MSAAAGAHHVGVADDDRHALERHEMRSETTWAKLVRAPARPLGADDDVDATVGRTGDAGLLPWASRSEDST